MPQEDHSREASAGVKPTSDHKGGTRAWKVLLVVFTLSKGGPDFESGAGVGQGETAALWVGLGVQGNNCPAPFTLWDSCWGGRGGSPPTFLC